jgi:hypothetical protein
MNLFTPEDMLRYLYNEMSADDAANLKQAMENDWSLREEFESLRQSLSALDSLHYAPRSQSVNSILEYAESTRPVEHERSFGS